MNSKMRAFLGMDRARPDTGSLTNPPRPDDDEPKATDVTISSRTVEAVPRDFFIDPGLDGAEVEVTTGVEGEETVTISDRSVGAIADLVTALGAEKKPDTKKTSRGKRRSKKQATDLD